MAGCVKMMVVLRYSSIERSEVIEKGYTGTVSAAFSRHGTMRVAQLSAHGLNHVEALYVSAKAVSLSRSKSWAVMPAPQRLAS